MKLISYSIFGADKTTDENIFEFRSYLRGFYFNVRMNNLIYPDWRTNLEVDKGTYLIYKDLFDWLIVKTNKLIINVITEDDPLCKAMMWRMKPIFRSNVTHVICRDTDAVTTYREAKCVQLWLESGLAAHAITDNPAHGGLMGGMVGFDSAALKSIMGWNTWEEMISSDKNIEWEKRGSDQHFMNRNIYDKIKNRLYFHALETRRQSPKDVCLWEPNIKNIELPQVKRSLWESDLTCRHIGSAGVVEMEMIRFFQRFDDENLIYKEIEAKFPEIFYWRIKK